MVSQVSHCAVTACAVVMVRDCPKEICVPYITDASTSGQHEQILQHTDTPLNCLLGYFRQWKLWTR